MIASDARDPQNREYGKINMSTYPEVKSVAELISFLSYMRSEVKEIAWFRGQRNAAWNVEPGIFRKEHRGSERNLTNRFRSRAGTRYDNLPNYDDLALWLSLMQHYGLPTRLLDWSRSPLVAVYFALESYIYSNAAQPEDAAIWILRPHTLNRKELAEDVTPSIEAHICEDFIGPAFSHRYEETQGVLAAMAAEHDLRMFVQQGCFTIHSDPTPLDVRPGHEEYLSKLIIPKDSVREMAHQIDICGFRKGDIFPDLQNLSDELKTRHGI